MPAHWFAMISAERLELAHYRPALPRLERADRRLTGSGFGCLDSCHSLAVAPRPRCAVPIFRSVCRLTSKVAGSAATRSDPALSDLSQIRTFAAMK